MYFWHITNVWCHDLTGEGEIILADSTFKGGIDESVPAAGLLPYGLPIQKVSLDVVRIKKEGTARIFFDSLAGEPETKWSLQEEATWFCREFPHFLSDGDINFFPVKINPLGPARPENLSFILVKKGRGLEVYSTPFDEKGIYRCGGRDYRMIIPFSEYRAQHGFNLPEPVTAETICGY